jgi:leader peptidase (prepilin peptidase) / N-methyltransferase
VTAVGLGFVALLGLAIGSFANVVIHRLPRGESLRTPPSQCPACGTPIRPWHNIPVLSFLALRGRCAACSARISPRYPLVEAVTALLFVAVTLRLSQLDLLSALPAYLYLVAIGIMLALIDIDVRRLPNAIVLPSYLVVAALLTASAAWRHDWWSLARAGLGAALLSGFFYATAVLAPGAMGFGDVKLAGVLGALLGYLSWATLVIGAFAGFALGAAFGVALILARRGTRRTAIPFGPFMLAGAVLALFVAAPLARAYESLFLFS